MRIRSIAPALLVTGVLAGLAITSSAVAAPQLTAPAEGASTAVRPAFSWTLDPGTTARSLEVSASAELAGTGSGSFASPISSNALDATSLSYVPTLAQQLYTGTYYWHVLGDLGGAASDSAARPFTVKKLVYKPFTAINSTRKGTAGTIKVKANTKSFRLNVVIKHGRTTCLNKSVTGTRDRSRLSIADPFRVYCYPVKKLAKGTRTKTIITLVAGGQKRVTVFNDVVA